MQQSNFLRGSKFPESSKSIYLKQFEAVQRWKSAESVQKVSISHISRSIECHRLAETPTHATWSKIFSTDHEWQWWTINGAAQAQDRIFSLSALAWCDDCVMCSVNSSWLGWWQWPAVSWWQGQMLDCWKMLQHVPGHASTCSSHQSSQSPLCSSVPHPFQY